MDRKRSLTLQTSSGHRRRVGAGLVVGRSPGCDVVLADRRVSGFHALIHPTAAGALLVPLGRNPCWLNGKEVDGSTPLSDGDRIELPGAVLEVHFDSVEPETSWMLMEQEGVGHTVGFTPFRIGSEPTADLQIAGWPSLDLYLVQGALICEALTEGLRCNDREVEPHAVHKVHPGAVLEHGGMTLAALPNDVQRHLTTHRMGGTLLPTAIRLAFQPTGGAVEITFGELDFTLTLAELRFRLLVAVLNPPGDYGAGDLVPDELLLPLVWPRQPEKTHRDLNLLVHRLRKDLVKAGVDGTSLLTRPRLGGGLRFELEDGATVVSG
jgi:hypothetical protein